MQTPLVSIIVPIYNVASYLKECLQSLVGQSYANLDIVLVDDESSDESLEIALEFAAKDERVFVVSKPNGGLSSARNTGLEFIKGSALREFCQRQNICHSERSEESQTTCHIERSEISQTKICHSEALCKKGEESRIPCHSNPEQSEGEESQKNKRDISLRATHFAQYDKQTPNCRTEALCEVSPKSTKRDSSLSAKAQNDELRVNSMNLTLNSKENSNNTQNTHPHPTGCERSEAKTSSARDWAFKGANSAQQGALPLANSTSQGKALDYHENPANFLAMTELVQDCHDLQSKSRNDKDGENLKENSQIQSLSKTHSFTKTTKTINTQEINTHFTQIQPNFIKSDLLRINDFIIQELPANALIHFVDSDDYLEKDCIEKCVKALIQRDLDLALHNIAHFYEDGKELKQGAYLNKLKENAYDTGLELLAQNKLYSLYFSVQGLFKASLLNHYVLRFSEGIYHEDHDFGTLLFCLAKKVSYINEALYIYRQRANSIINTQKDTEFPAKLPYFLAPLRADFKDYKALRAYFKAYCFVLIGFKLWHFYEQKSQSEPEFRQKFKAFFIKSVLSYMKIFKTPLNPDPLGIKSLLQGINFPKMSVLKDFLGNLHRQPKKLRYIQNLAYML